MRLIKALLFGFSTTLLFAVDFSYDTESDIYGFQFKVTGVELLDVYGGAAEEAGFQIAFNPSSGNVVAFSMQGDYIPAGQGTLLNIEYENGDEPCIQDLILSNSSGSDIIYDMTTCLSFTEACHGIENCNISNVLYTTENDIYGFQFEVNNAEIVDIYQGDAEEAGFEIAFNPSTGNVVAFSMQGDYIPAGSGILIKMEYVGDPCIDDLILSGEGGISIESYISNCMEIIEGCENIDECGICNGDGNSCAECIELSEWGCSNNPYCEWLSETVSCSGLSSSQCNAADGCNWTSSGGGDYGGGGSSYCSGGTGEINGVCFEIECQDLPQNECEVDSECTWISSSSDDGYGDESSSYCAENEILGCTDSYAENYNPEANTNDGSCEYGPLGTLSFHNYDYINNTIEVHMDCEFDVSNFEFSIDGLDILSFYGGTSENAEFNIELEGNTITGSSTSESNIPANSGLLMILNFNSNDGEICYGESSITTYIGIVYEAVLDSCVVPGCIDSSGCNYNINATDNDGTCTYPFCDGTCDSGAVVDECGVCGGEGIPDWACDCNNNVLDCNGDCGGLALLDECSVCDGVNTDCCPGDMNDDDSMDILDVIEVVSTMIDLPWPNYEVFCSDFNDDQILDIMDIIIMVDTILYGSPRYYHQDEYYANLLISDGYARIDSDAYITGIQMIISHGDDFSLELTDQALVADYSTNGNITNIIIVGLDGHELFNANQDFLVEYVIAGNSSGEIILEMPECSEMNQIQCNGNIDCNWVEDIESGSCSSLYSDECDSTPGCSWDYDCIQWGWWYNWCYEYGYECNGGTYEIDNGYCEEVELPDCSELNQNLCNHPAYGEGCEWVENIEYGDCDDVTNGSECYAIEECSWYSGGSYGYGFDGCYGGIYEIDNGYCEETVEYLMGDINGDSVVNILDVIETVNLILDGAYNYIVDMDNDSDVNVIDIIQMINIILNQIAQ